DMGETVQRLTNGRDIQETLGEAAEHLRAQDGQQAGVARALKQQNDILKGSGEQGEFAAPHLALASPAGIAATVAEDIHLHSERHIAITTGQHLSVATSKSLLASAAEKMVLFARKGAMRLFAVKGKIEIQAQSDDIEVIAQKVLRLISAQERIEITAKKEVLLNGGGSYIRINAEGIEHGTSGSWKAHANTHAMPGPKSLTPELPAFRPGYRAQYVLQSDVDGQPVPSHPYQLKTASGRLITGVTNDEGETLEVVSAKPEDVALDIPKIEKLKQEPWYFAGGGSAQIGMDYL
ncbi:DUF2345 domain-containing protein, partial [Cupriavidus basilensis]|uniref:DUF2345 domain-containing protein n=1 Tax=Cupriavidus basilensis TaxID=68895 RepID=UPI00157A7FC9